MLAMVVVFAASQFYRSHKTEALQKPTATASNTQQAASGAPQPVNSVLPHRQHRRLQRAGRPADRRPCRRGLC